MFDEKSECKSNDDLLCQNTQNCILKILLNEMGMTNAFGSGGYLSTILCQSTEWHNEFSIIEKC